MEHGAPVAVFGGTGFLGGAIVEHLVEKGYKVRIVSRHPERAREPATTTTSAIEPVKADIRHETAVGRALAGCQAAINAVGLYLEAGDATFEAVHVRGAERIARQCAENAVARLVHISGIGADATSPSDYVRARAEGEAAVRKAFPKATILRPSVLFGPGDSFFTSLAKIVRTTPVLPLFGRGMTRLQPVFVGDVAEAATKAVADREAQDKVFELGGPDIFTYRELLEVTMRQTGKKPLLLPVPFGLWHLLARIASFLPRPPITRAQVVLMEVDNVPAESLPGLAALGVAPTSVLSVLPSIMGGDATRARR